MLRTLEFLAIEYDQLGAVRTRSGNRSQYAAPGNVYRTADDKWASIAASTQSIFVRLCAALDLKHLLEDPRFALNPARVKNYLELDEIVGAAIGKLTLAELRETLHPARGRLLADLRHRRRLRRSAVRRHARRSSSVPDGELGSVRMQGVVPRFSETPGVVRHAGPAIGQHNEEVYGGLGLTPAQIEGLKARKVI